MDEEEKEVKILGSTWFTTGGNTIGIVIVEDARTGHRKAYIGVISVGLVNSKEEDENYIASHGATFPMNVAVQLIKVS